MEASRMNDQDLKAVILDMDGVITQTADVHARSWKEMFDEYLEERSKREGVPFVPFEIEHDYREYIDGKPRYDGVRSFLESRGIQLPLGELDDDPNRETIRGLGNRKNVVFHKALRRGGVHVFEDTVRMIDEWQKRGLKLAVISSSRNCEAVLGAVDLLERFEVKVDGLDLAPLGLKGKPNPDIFLHAARELGVEPREAMVVEDAISGVEAGRRGEFGLVVGVARDRPKGELFEAGADVVVNSLLEIVSATHCPPGIDCLNRPVSAMEHADWIVSRLDGKKLALFLDYDGTLTPIVQRPEDATLSDEMRGLLAELAERCTVAIVSGRDRRDAEQMVQLDSLVFAGSHGFDVQGPNGLAMQQEEAVRALPEIDEAEADLRQVVEKISGARVERKKYAIAIHYREVSSEHDVTRVEQHVDDVIARNPRLRKRGGKKIFEVQPDVPWDKGRAMAWLMNTLQLNSENALVIYLGDDVTDEDAFRMLRNRGMGIGIRVADPDEETAALYFLKDCDAVRDFLQTLRNKMSL
jgi:trehalose-phosphatase